MQTLKGYERFNLGEEDMVMFSKKASVLPPLIRYGEYDKLQL